MKTGEEMIRVEGVGVTLGGREVLKNVNLTIPKGEVFVLMGPSGCGKTTLLKCLMGLLVPTQGKILIRGQDIVPMTEEDLDEVRRRMGVSFQGGALINSMTVLQNVGLPLVEKTSLSWEEAITVCRIKLDMVGLLDAQDKFPAELSGGMKKRAAIARAMALDPEILYFDEPTSGLDPLTSAEIDELIKTLNKTFGVTVFAVTHDIPSAFSIGHRTAMMRNGELLAVETPDKMRRQSDPSILEFIERRPPRGEKHKQFDHFIIGEDEI